MKAILFVFIFVILFVSVSTTDALAKIEDKKEILIASWNMCDFSGGGPCGNRNYNTAVLENMTAIITGSNYKNPGELHDIIFVQELKNATKNHHDEFTGFELLCSERYLGALGYVCKNTEWMGDKSTDGNDEGYGVIFKNSINVDVFWTKNTDPYILQGKETKNHLVRPPMKAIVTVDDDQYRFVAYNNHMASDKTWTPHEFEILQNKINYQSGQVDKGNIVVLGDLNASCEYFKGGFEVNPDLFPEDDWHHIFSDDTRTNFAKTSDCGYDKIIPNDNMVNSFTGKYGIIDTLPNSTLPDGTLVIGKSYGKNEYREDDKVIPKYRADDKVISDHRLIWAQFSLGGIETTDSNAIPSEIFFDYTNPPDCTQTDEIFVRGEGFTPNKSVNVYVTDFDDNQNNNGNYKEDSYILSDIRGTSTLIITNDDGDIPVTSIWNAPDAPEENQKYNVVVDVNQDQYFTHSIM